MGLGPPGWGAETNNTRKLQASGPHRAHPAAGVRGDWEDLGTESKGAGRSGRDGEVGPRRLCGKGWENGAGNRQGRVKEAVGEEGEDGNVGGEVVGRWRLWGRARDGRRGSVVQGVNG